MIIVADASPIIFLAKIRQLALVHKLLGRDVRVPDAVCRELLAPGIDPIEKEEIEGFLTKCGVDPVRRPRCFAKAMSAADNAALTLAVRSKADYLLCDERVTRAMAEMEGVRPMGTLGVLLRATRQKVISRKEARRLVDLLISAHNLRIGIEVYQAVLHELAG